MKEAEVTRLWEANAEAWTDLTRRGYDVCRDGFNTPQFLELLPDVNGLKGLDIGCGEGTNTRRVAAHGAKMTGVDISQTFIKHAKTAEDNPSDIQFFLGSATALPLRDESFDFATSFMCLMDFPDNDIAIAEAYRVIRPGGFLQFSILHPCFVPPFRKSHKNRERRQVTLEVGRYFEHTEGEMEQWCFGAAPEDHRAKYDLFKVPRFHRTISWWLSTLVNAGFALEAIAEPRPTEEAVEKYPNLWDEREMPIFLHVRGRKLDPNATT